MRGLDVFRWLMPTALAALLSIPAQTANARGMGVAAGTWGEWAVGTWEGGYVWAA